MNFPRTAIPTRCTVTSRDCPQTPLTPTPTHRCAGSSSTAWLPTGLAWSASDWGVQWRSSSPPGAMSVPRAPSTGAVSCSRWLRCCLRWSRWLPSCAVPGWASTETAAGLLRRRCTSCGMRRIRPGWPPTWCTTASTLISPPPTKPGPARSTGSTATCAEPALARGLGKGDDDPAVLFCREDGFQDQVSFGQLRQRVAAARLALASLGVSQGDRVVALAPNSPDTLVAFLATASLGAVWASCSPDFGPRAIADRFTQLEPTVLIAVDGYCYGGKYYDIRSTVDALDRQIPSLRATVTPARWGDLLAAHSGAELVFEAGGVEPPRWGGYSPGP